MYNGSAVLTLVLDDGGNIVGEPKLTAHALIDDEEEPYILAMLTERIDEALDVLSEEELGDDEAVAEASRIAIRREFREKVGKRPLVTVHVVRV